MDKLEKLFVTTVDKDLENASEAILKRSIKYKSSTIFGHMAYSLGGSGTSIAVSGPHEGFSNTDCGI